MSEDHPFWKRLLSWPFVVLPALVVTLALELPAFEIGFFLDDHHLIALVEGWYGSDTPWYDLYAFFVDFPERLWWTAEGAQTGFFRPGSAALFYLDHALFGRSALGYHAHGLLWLALLLGAAALLYDRLPGRLGSVALVVYALDEAHGFPAGVICNRHALVSAVPSVLGVWAYLRWREDGWRPGSWLSPLAFAAALLASEAGIGGMAYVLAYELAAARGALRRRLVALAPVAAMSLVYVVAYKVAGYGPRGTNFYLNPLEQPWEFAVGLANHLPVLIAAGLVALPADLWILPDLHRLLVGVGAVVVVGAGGWITWVWRVLDEDRRRWLAWANLGSLGALLPMAATWPSNRQLVIPALGFSVVLGLLFEHLWNVGTRTAARRRILAGAAVTVLAVLHLGLAPLSRVLSLRGAASLQHGLDRVSDEIEGFVAAGGRDLVLVNAPDPYFFVYPRVIHDLRHGVADFHWDVLSMAHDIRLVRTSAHTLELEPLDGRLLDTEREQLVRAGVPPPRVGSGAEVGSFRAVVLETGEGGLPSRVAFRFRRGLDDPELVLLVWRDGRLERLSLPPSGEAVEIVAAKPL